MTWLGRLLASPRGDAYEVGTMDGRRFVVFSTVPPPTSGAWVVNDGDQQITVGNTTTIRRMRRRAR